MAESKQSEKFYLERFGMTYRVLLAAMGRIKVRDVDYADLYFEHTVDESISMEESLVKRASKRISQGVGVRATAGEKTGYAYSDEITLRQLEQAADTARYIARSPAGAGSVPAIRVGKTAQDLYPVIAPATEVATPEKVALLERIDRVARAYDPRIKNVMASFTTEYKTVLIANAEGELVGDVQPLSRLQVACIAEEHGRRRPGRVLVLPGGQPLGALRERGGPPGRAQPESGGRACRADDGGARLGLAGYPAPRGDRPRAGSRLQPQEDLRLHGPRRPDGRFQALHHRGRRHAAVPPGLAERG